MAKLKKIVLGDIVDFACLHNGEYALYPALVTGIHPDDGLAQALTLEVDFPEQLVNEGISPTQDHHREADPTLETPASGTWRRR